MGAFKQLTILAEENNRDAMSVLADLSRTNNPQLAIRLYNKLGRGKEALDVQNAAMVANSYEEDDIFS